VTKTQESEKIMTSTAAEFDVQYLQFLDENHNLTQNLPDFADDETLLFLYKKMSLVRAFDNKAINLQRQGKMSTYPASRGQEAISVGIGHALQEQDVFFPYYRDQGTMMLRGVKLSEILLGWGGDERGHAYQNPKIKEDFPICIPIAGQCLHAAGAAYAFKYRKQKRAALTTCGEGGSSKGDFYAAMNLAGAWNLPLVFVVNNNQWAISVPFKKQTACQTIAQKAIAAGFQGIQVDGNDIIAVRKVVADALEKARSGGGPTLIEAITYRLCDHTTADDASRYVPAEALKEAWKKEPIARLGHYLEAKGLWSKEQEAKLQEQLTTEIDVAVTEYLNTPLQSPYDLIDYLYEQVPDAYLDQRTLLGEQPCPKSHS
jgi:2-oxoisovalerate dehydrogenase E1 component alpha subunit